ncbi:hypothetical protein B0H14DRAFT_2582107 [Mycena olivaceomarginata]|nr:hypothetical protein B0H14DRAFT_2582107 [Mycena olivaceomarginata]
MDCHGDGKRTPKNKGAPDPNRIHGGGKRAGGNQRDGQKRRAGRSKRQQAWMRSWRDTHLDILTSKNDVRAGAIQVDGGEGRRGDQGQLRKDGEKKERGRGKRKLYPESTRCRGASRHVGFGAELKLEAGHTPQISIHRTCAIQVDGCESRAEDHIPYKAWEFGPNRMWGAAPCNRAEQDGQERSGTVGVRYRSRSLVGSSLSSIRVLERWQGLQWRAEGA